MFFMPRFLQFDSTKTILNRGNAILNKEVSPFSDTGDRAVLNVNKAISAVEVRRGLYSSA
jgi:hypothetical protein